MSETMNAIFSSLSRTIAAVAAGLMLLAILALVTLPHWLSVDSLNRTLANLTEPELGTPLSVKGFNWRWGWRPGLTLQGVSIGSRATAESVDIVLDWKIMVGAVSVHQLLLVDARIDLPAWQAWWRQRPVRPVAGDNPVTLKNLQLRGLQIQPWSTDMGTLNGDIQFDDDWTLTRAQLTLQGLAISVEVNNQRYGLHASAEQWEAPAGITLEKFTAEAEWQPTVGDSNAQLTLAMRAERVTLPGVAFALEQVAISAELVGQTLTLNSIHAEALGGKLQGTGGGQLADTPQLLLELELADIDLLQVAQAYALEPFAGELSATGVVEFTTADADADTDVSWQLQGDAQVQTFHSDVTGLNLSRLESPFTLDQNGLDLSELLISAYGGSLQGNVDLRWQEGLVVQGQVVADKLALKPLMDDLQLEPITGQLDGEAQFNWQGGRQSAFAGLALAGEWELYQGFLPGVDLGAVSGLMARTGSAQPGTAFDAASSKIKILSGEIQLTDIEVRSAVLAVEGDLTIARNGDLLGELQVGGNEVIGLTRVPVNVDGTLDEPRLRLTKTSVIGGAVGSLLLGPGLGTAVGVKVGEGLNKLKKQLFGADE